MPRKVINGDRIFLRYPQMNDSAEFYEQSKSSLKFHAGFVNPPMLGNEFENFVERNDSDSNECFLICENETAVIMGMINMSQIFYKSFRNAYLGYYLFAEFSGKGFMTEALELILDFAFRDLNLHRLEANIQPHNVSSINLVKRCGFTREGFSQKYLKIGGKWRDHERWAIIKENWRENKNE